MESGREWTWCKEEIDYIADIARHHFSPQTSPQSQKQAVVLECAQKKAKGNVALPSSFFVLLPSEEHGGGLLIKVWRVVCRFNSGL